MKRIPLIIALAMLTGSLCSCGSKSSSSSEAGTEAASAAASSSAEVTSGEETSAEDTSAANNAEPSSEEQTSAASSEAKTKTVKYKTDDKKFNFEVPEYLKQDDPSDSCEYVFTSDDIAKIGIVSHCDLHYSAKGFWKDIESDFRTNFDVVDSEELTVNGQPAVKVTTSAQKDGTTIETACYYILQYGNGDLFILSYSTVPLSSYDPLPDIEIILDSIVYKGDDLKTEAEKFSNKAFKLVIDEKLCTKSRDDYNVTVRYNLCDSMEEYNCMIKISAEKVDDVQEKLDSIYNSWSKHKTTKEISKDSAEILGCEAQHIFRTLSLNDIDAASEYYIFKEDGTTIAVTMIYPESMADKFLNDIKPMLDTFEIR